MARFWGCRGGRWSGFFPAIEKFAEIGAFIDRPVKEYSSGMYVRLAFSTAIHVDPEILIVDEALAVGDAIFANRCMKKFEELKEAQSYGAVRVARSGAGETAVGSRGADGGRAGGGVRHAERSGESVCRHGAGTRAAGSIARSRGRRELSARRRREPRAQRRADRCGRARREALQPGEASDDSCYGRARQSANWKIRWSAC